MANDVPQRVKYSFDTPVEVDRSAVIDAVYQAQTDLQIVAHWIASQPEDSTILFGALKSISYYRRLLAEAMPSVARH